MNNNISIIIADDHPLILKGLRVELNDFGFNVIDAVSNGAKALEMIVLKKPTIAILDINMPLLNGFEVIIKCQQESSNTKFILLTASKEKGFVLKAIKMNISGYLLKDEPFSVINKCIREVLKNKFYTSNFFPETYTNAVMPQIEKIKYLSPSERTIIRFVANRKSSKDIAQFLGISIRTVQKHRSNIISKLDLSSDSDSLSFWVKENNYLLDIE